MRPHRIRVHAEGTTIVLPCGLVVEGRPHDTESYAATAEELGYGGDVLQMCQDHDALHALLCEWLGIPERFALREAAGLDVDPTIANAEEAVVLAVQKLMRRAGGRRPERDHLRDLVLRFRHIAEHPATEDPFRSPEWRALCAATNEPRD